MNDKKRYLEYCLVFKHPSHKVDPLYIVNAKLFMNDVQSDTYVDGVFSRGFVPQILRPTRVTHCSATLIDHIISNDIMTLMINDEN